MVGPGRGLEFTTLSGACTLLSGIHALSPPEVCKEFHAHELARASNVSPL